MAPVDPELLELLETSSERSVTAVGRLEDVVSAMRRALDDARRAQDEDRVLEADRFRRLHERLDRLEGTVAEVDARCGALVLEEQDEGGKTVIRARPARVGLDVKTIVGLVVTLLTIVSTSPLLIELLK